MRKGGTDIMEEGFVYHFMAGVDSSCFAASGEDITLVIAGSLAPWIFGMAVVFGITGGILETGNGIRLFSMIRYGSRKQWWKKRFLHFALLGFTVSFLFWFILHGLDVIFTKENLGAAEEISILALWTVHMLVLVLFYCMLDLTEIRHTAPALLFTAEILSLVTGLFRPYRMKYLFGAWGMYVWSSPVKAELGFVPVAVMGIEGALIFLAYWIGRKRTEIAAQL